MWDFNPMGLVKVAIFGWVVVTLIKEGTRIVVVVINLRHDERETVRRWMSRGQHHE